MPSATPRLFTEIERNKYFETFQKENNRLKNPNWRKIDQTTSAKWFGARLKPETSRF